MSARLLPDDDPDVEDMHIARILAMSKEETRAELRALGIDPDEAVNRLDKIIADALAPGRQGER